MKFLWALSNGLNPFNPPAAGSTWLRAELDNSGPVFVNYNKPTLEELKLDYEARRNLMENLVSHFLQDENGDFVPEEDRSTIQKALAFVYESPEAMHATL